MDIVLYTIDCPACKALERLMNDYDIQYTICKDVDKMISMGMNDMPVLGIDDKLLNKAEAMAWVRERGKA